MKRKRSDLLDDMILDEELLGPKTKQLITEEKISNALKSLCLTGDKKESTATRDFLNNFDDVSTEKDELTKINGILLSDEVKQSIKEKHRNEDYELFKKLLNSVNSINRNVNLQIVLYDPNSNTLNRINDCLNNNNSVNITNKENYEKRRETCEYEQNNEIKKETTTKLSSSAYIVEEPLEVSPKSSLKRSYSEVNKIHIEEIDSSSDVFLHSFPRPNANKLYIVDEPTNLIVTKVERRVIPTSNISVKIEEISENDEKMES